VDAHLAIAVVVVFVDQFLHLHERRRRGDGVVFDAAEGKNRR